MADSQLLHDSDEEEAPQIDSVTYSTVRCPDASRTANQQAPCEPQQDDDRPAPGFELARDSSADHRLGNTQLDTQPAVHNAGTASASSSTTDDVGIQRQPSAQKDLEGSPVQTETLHSAAAHSDSDDKEHGILPNESAVDAIGRPGSMRRASHSGVVSSVSKEHTSLPFGASQTAEHGAEAEDQKAEAFEPADGDTPSKTVARMQDSGDSTTARHSNRVSQLKAAFERQSRATTNSEPQKPAGISGVGAARRGRRQSEGARPASPPTSARDGPASHNNTVSLIKSRFEKLNHDSSVEKSTCQTLPKRGPSRKLAEEALQQLGAVDIAARYGKPYRRREKQCSVQDGADTAVGAASHTTDKRTADTPGPTEAGVDSRSESRAEKQYLACDIPGAANAQRAPTNCGRQEASSSDQSQNPNCEAEQAHEVACTHGQEARPESPSAALCGRASPGIERLAALVAAQAQNYGKPIPRRLLTRQEESEASP